METLNYCKPKKDKYFAPLTGHLVQMANRFDYMNQISKAHSKYIELFFGPKQKCLLINDPKGIKHILTTNSKNYSKNTPAYKVVESVTGKGVFTENGAEWLKLRRASMPYFSNRNYESWEEVSIGVCNDLEKELKEICEKGAEFDFAPKMTELTLSILGEAIFKKRLGYLVNVIDKELSNLINITYKMITLKFSPNLIRKRKLQKSYDNSVENLEKILLELIAEQKKMNLTDEDSLIHAYMNPPISMNDYQLLQQVKTMVFAGHETTATVLTWALHLLSTHPEWQERIQKEIDENFFDGKITKEGMKNLHSLNLVIKETLRMYPAAWSFARRAIDEDVIEGRKVGKGDIVVITPYVLNHDEKFWGDPEVFRPERFLDIEEKDLAYRFIPFGAGARSCIGEKLANVELQYVLATFLKGYKLIPSTSVAVELEAMLTLRTKNGVHLKLEKRSNSFS